GQRLGRDEFRFEFRRTGVDFRPATPEAVIRFAAFLPRGERIVLRQHGHAGRVIVSLRDFDSEEAEMPTGVSYRGVESWLRGAPPRRRDREVEAGSATAGGASPPASWRNARLLPRLL